MAERECDDDRPLRDPRPFGDVVIEAEHLDNAVELGERFPVQRRLHLTESAGENVVAHR